MIYLYVNVCSCVVSAVHYAFYVTGLNSQSQYELTCHMYVLYDMCMMFMLYVELICYMNKEMQILYVLSVCSIFLQIAFVVVLSIISIFGFILNIAQLFYIIRRIRAKQRLAMDYFLISLTVGDMYRSVAIAVKAYLVSS